MTNGMKSLKWLLRKTLRGLFFFCVFIVAYLSIGFVLSRISTSKEEAKDQSVEVFVLSNGVHTDIVLPYKTEQKNWSNHFPSNHTKGQKKESEFRWVAVGWGDKGFYLETPTWGDLSLKTAFKAAFGLSSAAVHVTLYNDMVESESVKSMRLSKKQYKMLVKYIEASIREDKKGKSQLIETNAVYGQNDAFYESRGIYSMFHTCNTWANSALKACKQKACFWTWNSSSILRLHNK
jgi:uncharacterized protein (TIGR02117 family)